MDHLPLELQKHMQESLRFLLCAGSRSTREGLSIGEREAADCAPGDILAGERGGQRVLGDMEVA